MYPCYSFEDEQIKTLAYIRLEEDPTYQSINTAKGNVDYDKTNRKIYTNKPNQGRNGPYTKFQKSEVNDVQEGEESRQEYPSINEYNFSVDLAGLIAHLGQMGQTVRWPRKNDKPNPRRDPSKRCDFHDDIGHQRKTATL